MSTELSTVPERPLAAPEPSIGQLMQAVVEAGITEQSVAVMERLCALKERQDERAAVEAYTQAWVCMQRDLPIITANTIVPGNELDERGNKKKRYSYAKLEEIVPLVKPVMLRHGFTYRFSSVPLDEGKRVTITCVISHERGHSISTSYTGRIGSGPPKASEAQADGAGETYAKRRVFLSALGIVPEEDTDGVDAKDLGDFIPAEKAAELTRRAAACLEPKEIGKLLAFLGAESFAKLYTTRLEDAEWNLEQSEAAKKATPKKRAPLARPEDPEDPEEKW